MTNWKGYGGDHGPIQGTRISPTLAQKDKGEQRKISVMIASVPTEIRTKRLPDTRLDCYRYINLLGLKEDWNGWGVRLE
jgi:hypothetical protein